MFPSDKNEQRWRWRRFLLLLIIFFAVIFGITVWQVGPDQTPRQWLGWVGAALGGSLAAAGMIARYLPYRAKRGERQSRQRSSSDSDVLLYPKECGSKGIDLAQQRLLVSSAFGTYFAGLLERENGYVDLPGQIETGASIDQEALDPLQRVYWALSSAKGPQILIIAGEGGMGKSTLAARIVRCLFEEEAVDKIIGDSAKTKHIDPISGTVTGIASPYYDVGSFYRTLCMQLGLPYDPGWQGNRKALRDIRNKLDRRRTIIIVDNLETVKRGQDLLRSLQTLCTRDTRIIVTTRNVGGLTRQTPGIFLVRLKPLTEFESACDFLLWHIHTHAHEHLDLNNIEQDIGDKRRVRQLIDRTGGIPLLMQLVLSDVARHSSWEYVAQLPRLFGRELLDFLYRERWEELGSLGFDGQVARHLVLWLARQQYLGRKVTLKQLIGWANDVEGVPSPQPALHLLQERFLIINHDQQRKQGDFALFPSLVEFVFEYHQL